MSEGKLPEGWCYACVGDYLYLKNGFAFKSTSYVNASEHTYPVIRISDLNGAQASDRNAVHVLAGESGFEINSGDLLIAMSGATTGKIGVYSGRTPAYQNQRVGNIILHSTKYGNAKYRDLLISSLSDTILKIAYGGAQPNISGKGIEQITILLPPLTEQKIIADKLDTLLAQADSTKVRLEKIPQILKHFRQAVLAAAVSGKLTEEWRGTAILNNWKSGVLKNFIKKPSYGTSAKSQKEGLIPVLRMGNLQNGELNWSDLVYTSDENEIEKYNLIAGDILFNRTNSPELVGKTSIYRGEKQAIYAGYLIKIQCLEELNPEYLNYHLNSHIAKQYCYEVKSDGVSQSNINAQKLAAYPLEVPPIKEQNEIVRRIEQLFACADGIEKQVQNALERVNNLTHSILTKAFRGELTAQWRAENPELISGENSAQSLLVRIQQQRKSIKNIKQRKGKS
ncbi:restriction endonuclease subunit S [Pantoea dispersa]|uniref:restriction endonuclease subunit S n=1 Tax=Pantoea dispersa TaxID=59814 RepID=UPI001CA683E7|nr:restriction endonuclease subunit S [Pantoea dispersa]QZY90907.1 restriction endonuclease subunit S [Pantoea dispersa]